MRHIQILAVKGELSLVVNKATIQKGWVKTLLLDK